METLMQSNARPLGYSTTQIVLHWLIAALVIFQLIFGEMIVAAWRAYRRGTEATADDLFAANVHIYVGITVLVLATWRLALRFRYGIPPEPADQGTAQKWIAKITHFVLYLVIFGMPISGLAAWFGGVLPAGEFHEIMKPVIIVFVTLHALAALWQHFVAKTDVLTRMLRPIRVRA
jgi:cytochrome b561